MKAAVVCSWCTTRLHQWCPWEHFPIHITPLEFHRIEFNPMPIQWKLTHDVKPLHWDHVHGWKKKNVSCSRKYCNLIYWKVASSWRTNVDIMGKIGLPYFDCQKSGHLAHQWYWWRSNDTQKFSQIYLIIVKCLRNAFYKNKQKKKDTQEKALKPDWYKSNGTSVCFGHVDNTIWGHFLCCLYMVHYHCEIFL